MTEPQTYEGGCHCGAVRYRATLDLSKPSISCNCSICQKTGGLLAFTNAERFELLEGREKLTDYQFGRHRIHHVFCSTCGIRSFTYGPGKDGGTMYSVNVRCLDGVDPDAMPVRKYDGRSL